MWIPCCLRMNPSVFFSSRRRHTRLQGDWSSDVCSSDLATYGNAGFLREQVCKHMCPYARFQSAMFDKDTLVVTYDTARGESRGPRHKGVDYRAQGLGDCIDCTLCVQVCPVGIDIRDGLQYECIGCGLCIDACNSVMDRMHYPRGLIRLSTQNGVARGWRQSELVRRIDRKSTRLNSSHLVISYAVFCLKKKKKTRDNDRHSESSA